MTCAGPADTPRTRTGLSCLAYCALLLVGAAAPAAAQDHVVELGLMFWRPSPELTLSTDALAGSSTSQVDFVQEFGIEDKTFPQFRAAFGRNHKFRLSYVNFNYDADAVIGRTFTFQGRTFAVDTG